MLGVLCATRSRPWISSFLHSSASHHIARLAHATVVSPPFHATVVARRHHSSACKLQIPGGAASIWHAIMPSGGDGFRRDVLMVNHDHELKGEGSWNVAWDARPARWLHRSDSAWLLFGVCACLAPPLVILDVDPEVPTAPVISSAESSDVIGEKDERNEEVSPDYRVTGSFIFLFISKNC